MAMCGRNSYTKYSGPFQAKQFMISLLLHNENELQWSINDYWSCKQGNGKLILSLLCINDVTGSFIGSTECDMVTAPFWKLHYPISELSVSAA